MHFLHIEGRRYAQFEQMRQEAGLVHAFSTRPANLTAGHNRRETDQRRIMAADWRLDAARMRYCQQVHETRLAIVDRSTPDGPLSHCDGALTALSGVPLMTFSADCPLVLAYDPGRRVAGMAHASWRCTVTRATGRLVELMVTRFGCRAADMLAGVGPAAGPCCYEVRDDVYEAADALRDRDHFFQRRDGRMYFDLWEASRAQLMEAGIQEHNTETADLCTLCHNEVFYSYRREGVGCGHFGLLAALLPG